MSARPRFDWFQTDDKVTLTILKRGVKLEDCRVAFSDGRVTVKNADEVIFEEQLEGKVDEQSFTVTCTPAKVEVRMPKSTFGRWTSLTAQEHKPVQSVSFVKKDWDAVEKAVKAEEEKESEELEGDAAVNRMFQKIYADASDDVKKAMIKSFSESGGTVLSTNWEDIKKKKTEIKPPDSMEFKRYEQ